MTDLIIIVIWVDLGVVCKLRWNAERGITDPQNKDITSHDAKFMGIRMRQYSSAPEYDNIRPNVNDVFIIPLKKCKSKSQKKGREIPAQYAAANRDLYIPRELAGPSDRTSST